MKLSDLFNDTNDAERRKFLKTKRMMNLFEACFVETPETDDTGEPFDESEWNLWLENSALDKVAYRKFIKAFVWSMPFEKMDYNTAQQSYIRTNSESVADAVFQQIIDAVDDNQYDIHNITGLN